MSISTVLSISRHLEKLREYFLRIPDFLLYVHLMFSSDEKNRPVYFGIWDEEPAERRQIRAALAVLRDSAAACADRDVCTRELEHALAFLEARMIRPALCSSFRNALDLRDPLQRRAATIDVLAAIEKAQG